MGIKENNVNKIKRIYSITIDTVYPLYVQKAERKGRVREEVNRIIFWLTGYDELTLKKHIDMRSDLLTFIAQAPNFNPNASRITGVICGYRVEEIEDEIERKIRYLDKLIDELAKGKAMEKILRS
jgi:hypothetical protein